MIAQYVACTNKLNRVNDTPSASIGCESGCTMLAPPISTGPDFWHQPFHGRPILAQPAQMYLDLRLGSRVSHGFRTFCLPLCRIAFVGEDCAAPAEGAEAGFEEGKKIWADNCLRNDGHTIYFSSIYCSRSVRSRESSMNTSCSIPNLRFFSANRIG